MMNQEIGSKKSFSDVLASMDSTKKGLLIASAVMPVLFFLAKESFLWPMYAIILLVSLGIAIGLLVVTIQGDTALPRDSGNDIEDELRIPLYVASAFSILGLISFQGALYYLGSIAVISLSILREQDQAVTARVNQTRSSSKDSGPFL